MSDGAPPVNPIQTTFSPPANEEGQQRNQRPPALDSAPPPSDRDPQQEPHSAASMHNDANQNGGVGGGSYNAGDDGGRPQDDTGAMYGDAGVGTHLRALMQKNILLKVRNLANTIIETCIPILFMLGLAIIWAVTSASTVPSDNFIPGPAARPLEIDEPWKLLQRHVCTSDLHNNLTIAGIRNCTDLRQNVVGDPSQFACAVAEKVRVQNALCVLGVSPNELLRQSWNYDRPRAVPTLDEAIMWKWIADASIDWISRFFWVTKFVSLTQGSGIIIADETGTNVGTRLVDYLNRTSSLFNHVFDGLYTSMAEVDAKLLTRPYTGQAMVAIQLQSVTATSFHATLYQNQSGTPTTAFLYIKSGSQGLGSLNLQNYHAGGLLSVQDALSEFYFNEVLNHQTARAGNASSPVRPAFTAPTPFVEFTRNSFYNAVGNTIGLIAVLAYLFPVSQLTKRIVLEKEQRLREAMMIMGLGTGSFYAAWFLTHMILTLITALCVAIVLLVTMLPKANFGIAFFLFFLFGLCTISMSGLFSTVFSSSRTAALMAPSLFFLVSLPAFALSADAPSDVMVPLSLLPPVAFGAGGRLLFQYEVTTGMTQDNLNNQLDEVPMITYLVMLGIDFILYTLLTLYFDQVIPSQWGTRKHPLFFIIDPILWVSGADKRRREEAQKEMEAYEMSQNNAPLAHDESQGASLFEPQSAREQKPSVHIRGLRKVFGEFVAVKSLELPMYENEVTVLLGHNGAGKTTTIGCMIGMLETDGGDCTVYGDSVRLDLARARRHMGFCPQHNILWDEMTCIEHLEFFGRLKGVPGGPKLTAVAEDMLDAVDLLAKRDFPAGALSGGQKRKLSVAMAFVGGSKMVFLDEPTAGMDVAARRHTWELIRRMSHGRTIMLTTHFMDEADLLGNTVAIMGHGDLKCSGSSVFLKSRLGVGYTLTIANEGGPEAASKIMAEVVQAVIPSAERLSDTGGGEVTVRLPMQESPKFPLLLEMLEANPITKSFGIGVTTLEEVFLKIGVDAHNEGGKGHEVSQAILDRIRSSAEQPLWNDNELGDRENPTPAGVQFVPLMKKRLRSAVRDTRTIILQIVLPVIAILLALALANVKFDDSPRISLRGDTYGEATDIPYTACPANFGSFAPGTRMFDAGVAPETAPALSQYLLDNYNNHKDYPVRLGGLGCSVPVVNHSAGYTEMAAVLTNESYRHSPPVMMSTYHGTAARQVSSTPTLNWDLGLAHFPLSSYADTFVEGLNSWIFGMLILIPFTFIPSTFVGWIVKERESKSKHLQLVSGLDFKMYWVSNYLFDTVSFLITMFLVIILFLLFDREEYVGSGEKFGAIFLLLLLFGLASIAGAYFLSFAFDSHSTAQNVVMFVNFVIGFFLVLIIFFLEYQPSTESAARALKWIFRIHPAYCLGDGIVSMAALSLIEIFTADTKGPFAMDVTGWNLVYLAIEVPVYLILVVALDHPSRELRQHMLTDAKDNDDEKAMIAAEDDDVHAERLAIENGERTGADVVQVVGLRKAYTLASRPKEDKEAEKLEAEQDEEMRRASAPNTPAPKKILDASEPTNIKGDKLIAVRNLTFGVRDQEVFGFLGTNGAGKTTTMNILTGAFPPTAGDATVMGHNCTTNAVGARRYIGYCPQFDALSELLTPPEHIELYAGLRGIAPAVIPVIVDVLMTLCELNDYRETRAGELSGGNKRKLSVAISLIGGPRVVFLDEPSAGMDPVARRGLWTAIQRIVKQCAVILTTHHLEEVEALAHRVAIMVDGEMRVLGALGHLKHKFGTGFELVVRVRDAYHEQSAHDVIEQAVPGAELQESRGQKLTYSLPADIKLSRIFGVIEAAKQQDVAGITDYSISQTSVEQIFLRARAGPMTAAVDSPPHHGNGEHEHVAVTV